MLKLSFVMSCVDMNKLEAKECSFIGDQTFLLDNLPKEVYEEILPHGELKRVGSQENVIEIGEYCTESFFVLKGAFVCQYFDEELGIERTVNFHLNSFHPFMTSIESYFNNIKSKYRLKAVVHSEIIAFEKSVVNDLIESDFLVNRVCFAGLISVLTSEINLRSKLTTLPSDKLYSYLITQYPQIIQQIPSKYIAEFMGITQEWLCKLKRRT